MTMTIEYALLGMTQLNSMKWENHNIKWIAHSIMAPDNDILQTMKHRLQMDHWEIKLSRIPFSRSWRHLIIPVTVDVAKSVRVWQPMMVMAIGTTDLILYGFKWITQHATEWTSNDPVFQHHLGSVI